MTEVFAFTRSQLIDAIANCSATVATSGPLAGKISAESMAGAIIAALTPAKPPVHYRWPPQCMSQIVRNETWTGDLDRVTCGTCRLGQ